MNFAVFLMGENFHVGSEPSLQGFFITKGIEAVSEEAAATQAIEAVRADPLLSSAAPSAVNVASPVTVMVVHPLPRLMPDTEYHFFPMEAP